MSDPGQSAPFIREEEADSSAFAEMERTPENHFALHFHAAVYAVLASVRSLRDAEADEADGWFADDPFLGRYLNEQLYYLPDDITWREGRTWWWEQIQEWEEQVDVHLPLRTLASELGFSSTQRLAFVLLGVPEEDSRFGTLFADLQAPVQRRRPTVELIGHLAKGGGVRGSGWTVCRPLVEAGIAEVIDRDRPRSEWALRVPSVLWEAAQGVATDELGGAAPQTHVKAPHETPSFDDLILAESSHQRLVQVPRLLREPGADVAVVRGPPGSDRLAALEAVAQDLNRGVVKVQDPIRDEATDPDRALPDALGPFCVLTRSMPIVEIDLSPGQSRPVPPIPGYDGPVGVALGPSGGLTGERLEDAISLSLDSLSAEERRRHWTATFEAADTNVEVASLDAIVDRFQLPGRYLRRAAQRAVRQAALDGRQTIRVADVRRATRILGRQRLDTLAERVETEGTWDHLVVDPMAEKKLHDLERRCHHRERLLNHLGPAYGTTTTKGVSALFAGPSGTGKTLAARILAAELGMDLYRVDLASVINKYVGETEKNLHQVLTAAEELDVILLLDEGDALLGRRTEVSTANDRYANVETNYLLQRLEHHTGIVLVTSNLADNIDPAFQRRMDLVVDFGAPAADERLSIWALHLPDEHDVSESLLERVARECRLNGGQIRNAALTATLRALDAARDPSEDDGEETSSVPTGGEKVTVRDEHLLSAVRDEYRKEGAICPIARPDEEDPSPSSDGAQQFVEDMTR